MECKWRISPFKSVCMPDSPRWKRKGCSQRSFLVSCFILLLGLIYKACRFAQWGRMDKHTKKFPINLSFLLLYSEKLSLRQLAFRANQICRFGRISNFLLKKP